MAQDSLNMENTLDFEITESLENEKISGRTSPLRHGNVTMTGTFALKPTEAGTEMTYVVGYEMPWGIPGKILEKLFLKRALEKENEKELKNLKSILEK